MIEEKLEKLGFHKNEIKVYLALFEIGQSRAGKIIEYTKIHRNLVYTALDSLEQKKLISKFEKGKVFVFEINSPETIKYLIDEKNNIANEVVNELNKKLSTEPRDVKIYEGNEGIMATREIIKKEIQPGEDYSVMGVSYSNSNPEITNYFAKFNKYIIEKKGANFHALISGNEDKKLIVERNLAWDTNARYLPFTVNSPMWFALFRDTLNISITGNDPITFSIKSAETAKAFKKYFEYFWNQDTHTLIGADVVRDIWLESLETGHLKFIGARGYFVDRYPEMFAEIKAKAKKIKNLKWQNVVDLSAKEHKLNKLPWMEARYTMTESKNPNVVWLWGNKVAIANWTENEPVIFISSNTHLVQSYNDYFEELWNKK